MVKCVKNKLQLLKNLIKVPQPYVDPVSALELIRNNLPQMCAQILLYR